MVLQPISSYGSISTFQDYVSDIDEEMGEEDEFRDAFVKVRAHESCRRQAFLLVILLTFVVILFGVSATEGSPWGASKLCQQLLAFLAPAATDEIEN